jgi:hypothetical protein
VTDLGNIHWIAMREAGAVGGVGGGGGWGGVGGRRRKQENTIFHTLNVSL